MQVLGQGLRAQGADDLLHGEARRADGLAQVLRALSQPDRYQFNGSMSCLAVAICSLCNSGASGGIPLSSDGLRGLNNSLTLSFRRLCSGEEPSELLEVIQIQQVVQVRP